MLLGIRYRTAFVLMRFEQHLPKGFHDFDIWCAPPDRQHLALPFLAQAKLQDAFVHGRRESAVCQCPESRVLEGTQLGNALYSGLPNAGTLRFTRVPALGL